MKIIFDAVDTETRATLEKELSEHQLAFPVSPLSESITSYADAEVLSVFVSTPVTAEYIQALPKLKHIAARSTGYDHIDLEAAKARGITVSNVPVYGARTVAEFTFALILGLSRKAYAAADRLRREGTTDVKDYEGFDLAGKTIGIVGTGNIGKNVARIASGLAMRIVAFDPRPDTAFAETTNCTYLSLEELVAQSDIVTLHVPHLPSTHHLIDAALLAKFKRGSFLINTSRGAIVDTPALIRALKAGSLAGAGLDVIEGERELLDEASLLSDDRHDIKEFQALVAAHMLVDMPQVIVTPHIAFNTKEAKREILMTTCENIKAFAARAPINIV